MGLWQSDVECMFELSGAELRLPTDRYNNDRGAFSKKRKRKKRKLYPRFDRNISLLVVGEMMACMMLEKKEKLDKAPNRLSYWKWNLQNSVRTNKNKTYIGEIINSGRDILNSAIDSAKFQSPQPAPMPKPGPIKINKQPFDFTQNQVQQFQKTAHGAPKKC